MLLLSMMLMAGVQEVPGQNGDQVAVAVTNYRALTRADVPCHRPNGDEEIVVCGAREADKYRVPFVSAGNVNNSVPLRTSTLTKDYQRIPCGQSAFTAQCGSMVGVSATFSADGSVGMMKRELAH